MRALLVVAALIAATTESAQAQDRPSEEALFGGPEPGTDAGARPSEDQLFGGSPDAGLPAPAQEPLLGGPAAPTADRDEAALTGPAAQSAFDTEEAKVDPLQVGGTFYLRSTASWTDDPLPLSRGSFSAPSLLDAYLDARPTERVRGMALARLRYDPTLDPRDTSSFSQLAGQFCGAPSGAPAVPGAATTTSNPSVALDQLWIRFDIARTVFVTAGKQHVKWGTSRFWTPTDFLTPQRRDPLAVFDERLGANMVKVHIPWEERGWNFYAIGLLDNAGPANAIGELGGAARAEIVLGQTELGADAVVVKGRRPRYGFDLSSALGPVDVHAEVALRSGHDFRVARRVEAPSGVPPWLAIEESPLEGPQAFASGGLNYQFNYTDNDAATVGVEYFYNPAGYDDPLVLPHLFCTGQYQPFYSAKHYAGAFALLLAPGPFDDLTVTLSTLGNLSDLSFVSRADFFVRVLTYLTVEAYGAVHYGNRPGEFRLGFDSKDLDVAGLPDFRVPAPLFDLGLGLRISL